MSCTCIQLSLEVHNFYIYFWLCLCEQVWTHPTCWRLWLVLWSVSFYSLWWEVWAFSCSRKSKCCDCPENSSVKLFFVRQVMNFINFWPGKQKVRLGDFILLQIQSISAQMRVSNFPFPLCVTFSRKCWGRCTFNLVLIEELITLTIDLSRLSDLKWLSFAWDLLHLKYDTCVVFVQCMSQTSGRCPVKRLICCES